MGGRLRNTVATVPNTAKSIMILHAAPGKMPQVCTVPRYQFWRQDGELTEFPKAVAVGVILCTPASLPKWISESLAILCASGAVFFRG